MIRGFTQQVSALDSALEATNVVLFLNTLTGLSKQIGAAIAAGETDDLQRLANQLDRLANGKRLSFKLAKDEADADTEDATSIVMRPIFCKALEPVQALLQSYLEAKRTEPTARMHHEISLRANQDVLEVIAEPGSLNTTQIASSLGKSVPSVSRSLTRLKDAGVIWHPGKRRDKYWHFTEAGRIAWEQRDHVRDGNW